MASNIEITAQLNKMLVEQNQLYITQAKIMRGQLAIMQQLAEAMGDVDVSKQTQSFAELNSMLEEVEEKVEELSKSTQASDASVKKLIGSTKDAAKGLKKAASEAEKFGNQLLEISPAALAVDGAIRGLEFSNNILGSMFNIFKSIGSAIWGVTKALLAMPFEIWDAIMSKAGQPGDTAIATELENIRKQFGDLRTGSALAVREIAKNLSGPMVGTGLNAARVFGNMAERLAAVRESMTALGPLFNTLSDDIINNSQAVMQFQKGMGTSNEAMKAFGRTAVVTGRSLSDVQREYANYAIQLGKSFNINAREITQDMNELVGDMKHFGGMSAKALTETAVYARRLGVEVKNLTGLMDAFDNFDQAADAAARLNQQFGIQIDTMEIMKAENPAERAEMLRKAFEASGRSIETLDRRSKSYLASQIGLSEADAELLFAEKNRGRNLEDVRKKAEEAERKQLKQTEALQRLTGSIDRVVKAGRELAGIFDAFFKGFMEGFERSADGRAFIRELRQILRGAFTEGRNLGRVFTEIFPAIKAVMQGLIGFFNPRIWINTIHSVVDAFREFFRTVERDPEAGLRTLWDRLKRAFFDHFDALSGPGSRMVDSFKRYFRVILSTITAAARLAIPEIMRFLTDTLRQISSFIRGGGITAAITDTESIGGQIAQFFSALADAFMEAWPALWEAIQELFSVLWEKLSNWIAENKWTVLQALALYFAPSIVLSVLGGTFGLLGRAIGGRLIESIGAGIGAPSSQQQLTNSINNLTAALNKTPTGPVAGPPAGTAGAIDGANDAAAAAARGNEGTLMKALKNGAALGLFIVGALIPIVAGIIIAAIAIKASGVDAGSLIAASGVFIAAGLVVYALSQIIEPLSKIDITGKAFGNAIMLGILADVLGLLVGGGIAALALIVRAVGLENMLGAALVLGAMTVLFAALAGLAYIIKRVQINGEVIKGMLLIGVFAALLAAASAGIIQLFNALTVGITAEDVKTLSESLLSMSLFMLAMVPLIIAAGAMGAFLSGPLGLVILGFVAIGLIALGGFALLVVGIAAGIIQLANRIPAGEGTKEKVDLIVSIVSVIAELAKGLGAIVGPLAEVATEGLNGDAGGTFERVANKVNEILDHIVNSMVGEDGFVAKIRQIASTITEEEVPRLKAVTDVLGSFMSAMSGIGQVVGDAINQAREGSWYRSTEGELGIYIRTLKRILEAFAGDGTVNNPGLTGIVKGLIDQFSGMEGEPEKISAIATVISNTLTGLSNFIKTVSDMTKGILTNEGGQLENLRTFIGNVAREIAPTEGNQGLFGGINLIIQTLARESVGMTKERAEGVGAIAEIIGPILDALTGLVRAAGSFTTGTGSLNAESLSSLTTVVNTLFENLRTFLPTLVTGINTAFAGIDTRSLNSKVKTLANIADLISTVVKFVGDFYWLVRGAGGGMANWRTDEGGGISAGLGTLRNLFRNDTDNPNNLISIISDIVNGISGMDRTVLRKITSLPDFSRLQRVMLSLGSIANSIKTMREAFNIVRTEGGTAQLLTGAEIHNLLGVVTSVVMALTEDQYPEAGGKTMEQWIAQFNETSLSSQSLRRLTSFTRGLGGFANALSDSVGDLNVETTNRIRDIVNSLSTTISSLASIGEINVDSSLETLSRNLGLGTRASYTINNRNFQVVLNLDVTMEAGNFEKVLFRRSEMTSITTSTGRPLTPGSFRTPNDSGGFNP